MKSEVMRNKKQFWTAVALVNLSIVALLGFTLRTKILFPLEVLNFKHVLHAHSHYAFGGWVSLALLALMVHEILAGEQREKKVYQWFFWGFLASSAGMLISFLAQGYAFFSILFSTLFIFISYGFVAVFTKDLLRSKAEKSVVILSICSLVCLAVSSVGPFTLAYLMASRSGNHLLYRDSIYTYLHLQYNGFFTLGVFALFFNRLTSLSRHQAQQTRNFATVLCISIIPTLFISYLWHYPGIYTRAMAIAGCILNVALTVYFFIAMRALTPALQETPVFIRRIGGLAMAAFVAKSLLQMGTIVPGLGKLVFGDRAIIIGYLHLVLLGFVSLYLIAHLLHNRVLDLHNRLTRISVTLFATAVTVNHTILFIQGFGNMLMVSNSIYAWLLWAAGLCLFSGALLIAISKVFPARQPSSGMAPENDFLKPNIYLQKTAKYEPERVY